MAPPDATADNPEPAKAGLTALEFYSGIGGLHYGLLQASPGARVAAAFDLNDVANETYNHNFGIRPKQANVGKLTRKQLDAYGADVWMLSPPCQPYTRKGLKKQSKDGRAESFLEVLDLLGDLKSPPRYLLVENVVGFEASDTREHLVKNLGAAGYAMQEFILSPKQFGVPYSRPRYFALAKRLPLKFASPASLDEPPRSLRPSSLLMRDGGSGAAIQDQLAAMPVSEFLVDDPLEETGGSEPQWQNPPDPGDESNAKTTAGRAAAAAETADDAGHWALYRVPPSIIERHAAVLDVVGPRATLINCFTKTYTQYAKATGSVLVTKNEDRLAEYRPLNGGKSGVPAAGRKRKPDDSQDGKQDVVAKDAVAERPAGTGSASDKAAEGISGSSDGEETGKQLLNSAAETKAGFPMMQLGLRYFTPRELANFHSFPPSFTFPAHITMRQRYSLLGNSLSVAVVADLLKYLLAEPEEQDD